MKVEAIKTKPVRVGDRLEQVIEEALATIKERSVLAVTSKIVSICQGRVIKIGDEAKATLVRREAEYYIPPEESRYGITLTIKDGILIPTAGIDESNAEGNYILWPENTQEAANDIRSFLKRRFALHEVGVVITDSKTTPLRRGTTGIAMAHSGFKALNNYIGKKDIFGRKLHVTQANIMDGLAASAVLAMGEGAEMTPLALIEEASFIDFQDAGPTATQLASLDIPIEEDLYEPLLNSERWQIGGGGSSR